MELLYLEGCPHWETLERRLREALVSAGLDDVPIERTAVHTPAQASARGFIGSPTLRVDGRDPFAAGGEGVGLACRMVVPDHVHPTAPVLQWRGVAPVPHDDLTRTVSRHRNHGSGHCPRVR